jgi:hypothetical protein
MKTLTDHQFKELKRLLEQEIEEIDNPGFRLRAVFDEREVEKMENLGPEDDYVADQYVLQTGGDYNVHLRSDGMSSHVMVSQDEWKEGSKRLYSILDEKYKGLNWP